MCLSAGDSPRGSTTLRLLLRETPIGVFFLLWGWADARAERPYFVLAWCLVDTACRVPILLVWRLNDVSVYCGGGQ